MAFVLFETLFSGHFALRDFNNFQIDIVKLKKKREKKLNSLNSLYKAVYNSPQSTVYKYVLYEIFGDALVKCQNQKITKSNRIKSDESS